MMMMKTFSTVATHAVTSVEEISCQMVLDARSALAATIADRSKSPRTNLRQVMTPFLANMHGSGPRLVGRIWSEAQPPHLRQKSVTTGIIPKNGVLDKLYL